MAKSKKKKRRIKSRKESYSLLISLMISVFIVAAWSYIQLPRMYASYVYSPVDHPIVAVAMQGIHDGVYPWDEPLEYVSSWLNPKSVSQQPVEETVSDTDVQPAESEVVQTEADTGIETIEPAQDTVPDATESGDGTENLTESGIEPATETATEAETAAQPVEDISQVEETEPAPKDFIAVNDDYFRDALFIGDSRMVGLSEYCEPLDTRADFYVKKALTIYNILDGKPIRSFDGTSKSLWEVLEEKQYAKIYIMVGINEIGVGNSEYFKDAYSQVVDRIREAEPHALIFINSIMHVSKSKSDSDGLYNNPNINARNDAIASLADNISIFYLNVNEAVDDENGALRADLTFDDIHLRGSSYEPWHEYLLSHGIEAEPLPEVHHVLEGHPVE
ncbi:MAG: hypothetical protein J5509_12670 [Lachnospiraceae bacterium]|nr:hypothetical protein [Lachnospiraceae bacterium]